MMFTSSPTVTWSGMRNLILSSTGSCFSPWNRSMTTGILFGCSSRICSTSFTRRAARKGWRVGGGGNKIRCHHPLQNLFFLLPRHRLLFFCYAHEQQKQQRSWWFMATITWWNIFYVPDTGSNTKTSWKQPPDRGHRFLFQNSQLGSRRSSLPTFPPPYPTTFFCARLFKSHYRQRKEGRGGDELRSSTQRGPFGRRAAEPEIRAGRRTSGEKGFARP